MRATAFNPMAGIIRGGAQRGRGGAPATAAQRRQRFIVRQITDQKNTVLYASANHCVMNAHTLYRIYNGQNGYVRSIEPNRDDDAAPAYMTRIYGNRNQAQYIANVGERIREQLPPNNYNTGISDILGEFFVLESRELSQYDNMTPDQIQNANDYDEIRNSRTVKEGNYRRATKQRCALSRMLYARITKNNRGPQEIKRLASMTFLDNTMHEKHSWNGDIHFAMLAYRGLAALHLFHTRINYVHLRTYSSHAWMAYRFRNKDYTLLTDFRLAQQFPNENNFREALFDQNGNQIYGGLYKPQVAFVNNTQRYRKYMQWLLVVHDIAGFYTTISRAIADFITPDIEQFLNILREQVAIAGAGDEIQGFAYAELIRNRIHNIYNDRDIDNVYSRLFSIPFHEYIYVMKDNNLVHFIEKIRSDIKQKWNDNIIGLDTRFQVENSYPIPFIGQAFGTQITNVFENQNNNTIDGLFILISNVTTQRTRTEQHNMRKRKITNIFRFLARNQNANKCIETSTKEGSIGGKFVASLNPDDRANFVENNKIRQQVRMVNVGVYTTLIQLLEQWNTTKNAQYRLPVPDQIMYDEQINSALRYCPCIQQQDRCRLPVCRWADTACVPNLNNDDLAKSFQPTSLSNPRNRNTVTSVDYAGQYRANNQQPIMPSQPPLQYVSSWLTPIFE